MNRFESFGFKHIVHLIGLMMLSGCALTSPSRAISTITSTLAYDIPAAVDVKTVMDLLEESSMKVLRKPVTVDERTWPPLASDPSSAIILQENVASFEGLGEVVIPSIICPGALASMHTLMPSRAGIRLVASCIVMGETATRIYLTDTITGTAGGSAHSALSHEGVAASSIDRIGDILQERLATLQAVRGPDILIRRTARRTRDDQASSESFNSSRGTSMIDSPDITAHPVPVVCFTPKGEGIAVRTDPGSHEVIGTLNSELIVQEEDPGRNSFLHVTTREGRHGWVTRGDVRWTSCPVV